MYDTFWKEFIPRLTRPKNGQRLFEFDNGYGLSVINDGYGSSQGLFEAAVLYQGSIVYDTPITNDVLGYLSEDEVQETIEAVKALPPRE